MLFMSERSHSAISHNPNNSKPLPTEPQASPFIHFTCVEFVSIMRRTFRGPGNPEAFNCEYQHDQAVSYPTANLSELGATAYR